MEMGKLTAKLRDAVPVCLLVDDKEIKRYKNIEIPDELKKLEYQDFKFDVPLNGVITFRIMFEQGVLPEVFPEIRERRMRKHLAQEAQPQKGSLAEMEPQQETQLQDEQATEAIFTSAVKAFTQALEDTQALGEPVAAITTTLAAGEAIKAEVIEDEDKGRLLIITADPEAPESIPEVVEATTKAETQPEDREPTKKPARKENGKKNVVATRDKSK